MATIFDQIFVKEPMGGSRIVVHAVYGVLIELIDGKVDANAVKTLLDGSDESNADVDSIVALLNTKTTDQKYQWAIKFHARLLLSDISTDKPVGYHDDASFRVVMGY